MVACPFQKILFLFSFKHTFDNYGQEFYFDFISQHHLFSKCTTLQVSVDVTLHTFDVGFYVGVGKIFPYNSSIKVFFITSISPDFGQSLGSDKKTHWKTIGACRWVLMWWQGLTNRKQFSRWVVGVLTCRKADGKLLQFIKTARIRGSVCNENEECLLCICSCAAQIDCMN